jgi:hypothetical protein
MLRGDGQRLGSRPAVVVLADIADRGTVTPRRLTRVGQVGRFSGTDD